MGMTEERREWAASTEAHSKRMYEKTNNPYYIVAALAAARTGDFLAPEWALEKLLDAVFKSYWAANTTSLDVSIDAALGLTTGRGQTKRKQRALRDSMESIVFGDIRLLHSCFDLSIPDACELVYFDIDFSFAREMEESISWDDLRVSDADLQRSGMTREQVDSINAIARARRREILDSPLHNDCVREKLRARKLWEITVGDRLGYSLDHLIDRYHRDGARLALTNWGAARENQRAQVDSLRGSMLLHSGTVCISAIRDVPADLRQESRPAARLTPRPHFAAFLKDWAERGVL